MLLSALPSLVLATFVPLVLLPAYDDVAVRGAAGGEAAVGCIDVGSLPSAVGGAVVDAAVTGGVAVIGGVAVGGGGAVVSAVDFGGVDFWCYGGITVGGAASSRVVVGGYGAAVDGGAAVGGTDVGVP